MPLLRAWLLVWAFVVVAVALPRPELLAIAIPSASIENRLAGRAAETGATASSSQAKVTSTSARASVTASSSLSQSSTPAAPSTTPAPKKGVFTTTEGVLVETFSTGSQGVFVNGALQVTPQNDPEEKDRQENADRQTCATQNDCIPLCTQTMKNVTDEPLSICNYPFEGASEGVCTCGNGSQLATLLGNIFAGIGQVACQVFNKAVSEGIDLATDVIPGGIAVDAAEKAAVTGIKKVLKIGGDDGLINFCKGVNFTVVSSTLLNNAP